VNVIETIGHICIGVSIGLVLSDKLPKKWWWQK